MEVDTKRKLIIGALDPRHNPPGLRRRVAASNTGRGPPSRTASSGFYVISYADPSNMRQIGDFVELPSGHTSSCIQNCKYIWTGGPARRSDQNCMTRPSRTGPGPVTLQNRLIADGRPI